MTSLTKATSLRSDPLHAWSVNDSLELYKIRQWGHGFFNINSQGNVSVTPRGQEFPGVDLKDLVDELRQRGIGLPLLIRFSDILRARIQQFNHVFADVMAEDKYTGGYMGVYPIKVNQQRHIVEEIVEYGAPYKFGLEAGSKPELLAAMAMLESNEPLIICNGYKDAEYIDLALWATKLGKTLILVVEEYAGLGKIIARAKAMGVRPKLGIRGKLSTRGAGRWQESGGAGSKFGLSMTEVLQSVELLREEGMLDCLNMTHFHLGSQITNIRAIKEGLIEGARLYTELAKLGAGMKYLDVGGGMAVDYDGSSSNSPSSANYTMREYVGDVISAVTDVCKQAGVPHPTIITECGRALTAHQSVLVFNVLSVTRPVAQPPPSVLPDGAHLVLRNLLEMHESINSKNFQEAYHDALHLREESLSLFKHGILTLADCGVVERIFWSACRKILRLARQRDYLPSDLAGLAAQLSDTYICNMSVFQSVPDCWAVDQLFPVMPIHRLSQEPTCWGTLADLTCDSDGKIDRFIDLRDVKPVLELHPLNGDDYLLGVFMIGAYQETLGDIHNLFGDTNAVHVTLDEEGQYHVTHVVEGDSVDEVLHYVQYSRQDLVVRFRRTVEAAVRAGRLTFAESAELLRRYEAGLSGYTYLSGGGD